MAWGVEARVPFLDYDFLDVCMQIDPLRKMVHRAAPAAGAGEVSVGARRRMEKFIIRRAFDVESEPYLPEHILWRQKEQFSDGVGYGWIDALRDHAAREVSDSQLAAAANLFPENPPATKEGYLYRQVGSRRATAAAARTAATHPAATHPPARARPQIFTDLFPSPAAAATVPSGKSIACSTERALRWDASFANRADCSGRAVAGVHNDAYAVAPAAGQKRKVQ